MHTEFAPQPSLLQDVKCFWTLEATQAHYNRREILPDSYVELIFNGGAPLVWEKPNGTTIALPHIFLKSLENKPLRFKVTGSCCQIIGMRLYPWTIADMITTIQPQNETPIIGLNHRWNALAHLLNYTLRHNGYEAAIDTLHQFVTDNYQYQRPTFEKTSIQKASQLLYATHGQMKIEELAIRSHLSPRQFERRFKRLIGRTPKTFARLVRFEAVRDTLYQNPARPMTDLAYQFGYTDQSHFIHDFKAFAGYTPSEYVNKMN
jgi:AraC-like DNA-binding protein